MKHQQKHLSVVLKKILWLLLIVSISSPLAARNNSTNSELDYLLLSLEELGNINTSIATGNSTSLDQAPAAATVITAKQIQALGASTIDDVLETVPGLHIALSGAFRLDTIYSIRGIHTTLNSQVLLLINGYPTQYSVSGGRPPLLRQSVNNVSRIEVLRGPGSAIYGSDAFSGVINIITKSAREIDGTEVGSKIGSFGFREAWLQSGHQFKKWDVNFSLNHQQTNGDSDRTIDSDFQTSFDKLIGTSASLAPGALATGYEITDASIGLVNEHWAMNARTWQSNNTGNGAGGAQSLDPESKDDLSLYTTDISFETSAWFEAWDNSVKLNYAYFKTDPNFTLFPKGSSLGIGADGNLSLMPVGIITFIDGFISNPSTITEDAQIESVNVYNGIKAHRLRVTFGRRYQSIETTEAKNFGPGVITSPNTTFVIDGNLTDVSNTDNVFLENTSRTINFFSLQDEWQIGANLDLISGVRYDNYSNFGDTINPRVALVWRASDALTTKLLYGSAFRAPSFGELGLQNTPGVVGNKNLAPETIDSYELGLNFRPRHYLQTTFNLFTYQAKDLIELRPSTGGNQTNNARDQEGYGFEWGIKWKLNKQLRFNANLAWQRSHNSDTNNATADAPGRQFMLNSYWKLAPQWLISSQVNWVGDRVRAASDLRDNIADYTLVNLVLKRRHLYKNLDITFGVRNAFDRDAREPSSTSGSFMPVADDFPLAGRSFWTEVRYQL
ncbi:MAG: outer membrane receptor for ferrienterochelin and colicins [Pseudohongiellaceae bacterium]